MQINETEMDLISSTEQKRLRALAQRDMDLAQYLHADDFQLITPGGSSLPKQQYLDRIASRRIEYLACEPDEMEVRTYGEAAVVRYQSRLQVRIAGTPDDGRFWHTDLYEKREGRWQVVWSQATRQSGVSSAHGVQDN